MVARASIITRLGYAFLFVIFQICSFIVFISSLKFNGKNPPVDNGRKQAGRVLLNLGTYADGNTGFLDFVRIDGVTILAPLATIKYPLCRVEMVVMVGANDLLYSVEVRKDATHTAIQLENDVMASRDFILRSPQMGEPVESQPPTESPEPSESQPATESPAPSESQQPVESPEPSESQPPAESPEPSEPQPSTESPRPSGSQSPAPSPEPTSTSKPSPAPKPSGTPAPSPSQSAAPSVSPAPPDEVTPPVVDNTPQPSEPDDPNHIAYVPGSTVEIGNSQHSNNSPSPAPSESAPVESQTGDVHEQDPGQNSTLPTILRVVVVVMVGIVVLLIIVWSVQLRKEREKRD